MFKKFHKDLEFGFLKENEILPIIKDFFNDETIQKLDKYNTFDFKGINKYIELKSRHNNLNKYPTTMIGYNKIRQASTLNEDVYFLFSFDDYLCYWKYDRNINLEIKRGGRFDRIKSGELNDYCYIPINLLQKIII